MVLLAGLRSRAKDYKGAKLWLVKAAALAPDDAGMRATLAETRFKADGDPDQARLDFAEARSRAAGEPMMLNNLCYVQATLNLDLETALGDCDAALKLRPGDPSLVDSRAFTLLRLNRNAEAKAAYDEALAIKPTLGASLYGRSLVERRLGDGAAADRDLKAATAADPKVVETFAGYGVTR